MKISLITVSYNSEETIRETFESVRQQKTSGFELEYIHVDGLSSDTTMKISQEFDDIISKRISEKDSGIYNAMNKGISNATGDIIGILNSDDCFAHHLVLQNIVDLFSENFNKSIVYSNLNYVSRNSPDKIIRKWRSGNYKKWKLYLGWMPPHPTFYVARKVYQKIGVFDEKLKSAADYDLMLRALKQFNSQISYNNDVTIHMKDGGNSGQSIAHRLKVYTEDRQALRNNKICFSPVVVFLKILRKIPQFI